MFKAIQERLFYLYKEKKQPVIIAIDEAQYLTPGILQDLKMLMNFRYDSLNCFTLILSGEPVLNRTFERPVNEALRQRITVHYTFKGLIPDETVAYVLHKIRTAGGSESIISEDALTAISHNRLLQGKSACHRQPYDYRLKSWQPDGEKHHRFRCNTRCRQRAGTWLIQYSIFKVMISVMALSGY